MEFAYYVNTYLNTRSIIVQGNHVQLLRHMGVFVIGANIDDNLSKEKHYLRFLNIALLKMTVAQVDKSSRIIAVTLASDLCVFLSAFDLVLNRNK